MTKKGLIKKLEAIGFDLEASELAVLQLDRIQDLIENMDEGQANTFIYEVKNNGLFDALRYLGLLIAPIEKADIVINREAGTVAVYNDVIDIEEDTIFVVDYDYTYEAFDTEYDCSDDEYLYFNLVDDGSNPDEEESDETYANIEIELYSENGQDYVYLSNDGSSGCKYKYDSKEELKKHINNYIDDLFV